MGETDLCVDGKATVAAVPLSIEGCIVLDPSWSNREVTLGGDLSVCLFQDDPCGTDNPSWVENQQEWTTVSCQPCLDDPLELTGTFGV